LGPAFGVVTPALFRWPGFCGGGVAITAWSICKPSCAAGDVATE
jgi:hypothetical protein